MSNDIADLEEFNRRGARTSLVKNAPGLRGTSQSEAETVNTNTPTENSRMWAVYGEKNFSPCEKALPEIPSAQFTIKSNDRLGVYFERVDTNLDDLIHLPDSVSEEVFKEIETFWTKEEHFRKLGFMWKRGILTWGPPGSGKTSCLQTVSQRVIARGGLSVYVENPELAALGLKVLRHIEPTRPILVMLEDVDAIIDRYGEATLLALMDGELQIDNVVFIATTNYPEKLDKRFSNRPSRFDLIKKIGMPSEQSRELYIKTKNVRLAADTLEVVEELANWVDLTHDFSIAHIKELIVSVEVFGVPVDVAVKRLKTMMNVSPKSSDKDGGFGFTPS